MSVGTVLGAESRPQGCRGVLEAQRRHSPEAGRGRAARGWGIPWESLSGGARLGGDPGARLPPPQHDCGERDTPSFCQLLSDRPRTLGKGLPGTEGISSMFQHILGQLALLTLTCLVGQVVLWDPGGISEDLLPAAPPSCPQPPLPVPWLPRVG